MGGCVWHVMTRPEQGITEEERQTALTEKQMLHVAPNRLMQTKTP